MIFYVDVETCRKIIKSVEIEAESLEEAASKVMEAPQDFDGDHSGSAYTTFKYLGGRKIDSMDKV